MMTTSGFPEDGLLDLASIDLRLVVCRRCFCDADMEGISSSSTAVEVQTLEMVLLLLQYIASRETLHFKDAKRRSGENSACTLDS